MLLGWLAAWVALSFVLLGTWAAWVGWAVWNGNHARRGWGYYEGWRGTEPSPEEKALFRRVVYRSSDAGWQMWAKR